MQTPASVDVITRDQLEARGDASLVDAITRSPGISSLAHPGNSGSSLQARGFIDTTSVMRLYDGTRQYGGVVNVIPKKPTRGPIRNEIQATVGDEGKRALAFGSGGAINDLLSYRLDFADPGGTSVYLDPYTGDVALSVDNSQRVGR